MEEFLVTVLGQEGPEWTLIFLLIGCLVWKDITHRKERERRQEKEDDLKAEDIRLKTQLVGAIRALRETVKGNSL